jgi:cation transport ATPase
MVPRPSEDFDAISGRGVRARVDGADVLVGRPSFVAEHTGGLSVFAARADELEDIGRTVVAVSRDGELKGLWRWATTSAQAPATPWRRCGGRT